ncbi:hypothetical protein EGH10_02405 [Brevibacillus laterosporus]|uniref:Uncharacterized protein n=1 Tax=Brevibacillus laterosporus LMG 15441 TaxID=1042163 RepID=A0A075R6J8_BRELA|nr:hypothetical protein [Brevibacillus laterosporus]AIG28242.1 hypothetical protein BRLA_c039590 [Brevibacillus laterosporus LMG 15441]RJL10231.1 hypothetical protein DM460_13290 [Brevibacillus laterosporus]TPH18225.1 hypothetical protein EGH10_02405 [Brevibacillus laterosporus]HAS00638.1 hypothetical protein [Brevibacillus sp.]
MASKMLYYLAAEEDHWLDELLDYFPIMNATVPTKKSLQMIEEQLKAGEITQSVLVINVSGLEDRLSTLLEECQELEHVQKQPLYLVGIKEGEEEQWRNNYPQAKIVAITGFLVEFDFEAVCREIEADLGGK